MLCKPHVVCGLVSSLPSLYSQSVCILSLREEYGEPFSSSLSDRFLPKMQDEEYLIRYRIPHLIDELLLDMVKDRPEDVIQYFMDWLAKKKGVFCFVMPLVLHHLLYPHMV